MKQKKMQALPTSLILNKIKVEKSSYYGHWGQSSDHYGLLSDSLIKMNVNVKGHKVERLAGGHSEGKDWLQSLVRLFPSYDYPSIVS